MWTESICITLSQSSGVLGLPYFQNVQKQPSHSTNREVSKQGRVENLHESKNKVPAKSHV